MSKTLVNKIKVLLVLAVVCVSTFWVGLMSFAKAETFDVTGVTLSMQSESTILTEENDGVDGISFKAELSSKEYEGLKSLIKNGTYKSMETGLIIAPNYYNNEVEINEESLFGKNATYDWATYEKGEWVYEESDKIRVINIYTNDWVLEDGVYTYSGGIVDILDKNQTETFYATAYIKLTDFGDIVTYIFADSTTYTDYTEIFTLNETGDTITGLTNYGQKLTEIVIPEKINGVKITSIGSYAFYDCDSLTSVTIGGSVESIGSGAFSWCSSLTSVTIGDSVTSIGEDAFSECYSLTNVTIGDSVKSIGDWAFLCCYSLTSVVIPDSVESIGSHAFVSCDSLTSIVIPASVTIIGEKAFYSCDSLTSIEVDSENEYYKSIDGNLYTKDGKTLIQYAIGKTATSFIIPDSVESIGDYAFYYCDSLTSVVIGNSVKSIGNSAFCFCESLTSVVIPDSVTSIGDWAFSWCSSLTSVVIPDSVESIGMHAFSSCDLLESITFNGTKKEWNAITKGTDWKYRVPATFVQCSDGRVYI